MADEANRNRNKRKRKKSVLQNARKYGRKGYYGRGSRLSEDTYQYFVRIMEAYKAGFESEEEKAIFANNVFEQTDGTEIECCRNQIGCRVVEMLLPHADDTTLERYAAKIGDELRPLCSDRFAGHVVEALLAETCRRSQKSEASKRFTLKASRFLLNNVEDYMWDTYGNHVLRSVVCCLAQIPRKQGEAIVVDNEGVIPDYFLEIVNDYGERIVAWPQFDDLPFTELTSGFLQVLLRALKKTNERLLKTYVEKMVGLKRVLESQASVMLLEVAIEVAPQKLRSKIWEAHFQGKMMELAVMRSANFAVQKMLNACTDKAEFETMFEELDGRFREIVSAGHTGVLLSLGQACKRLSCKQGSYVQNMMKAFGCLEPPEKQKHLSLCLAKLTSLDEMPQNYDLERDKLNLHGTLALETMLEFNKPIKIVNSILETDAGRLKELFCNSMGSHVVDAFVRSQYVGEKSRERLVRKMQGYYQEMASKKYGSRSFEALWNVAAPKPRAQIMEELAQKEALWSNTEHGKIIASKTNMRLYKRNKEEWKKTNGATPKKKDLLEDVLKT